MRNEPQQNKKLGNNVGVRKLTLNLPLISSYQHIFVAYSGGLDSHVLLHLCAADEVLKNKLSAVYINHNLQQDSTNWSKHCEAVCLDLGVKFLSISVDAAAKSGESPEEAARNARYSVFKSLLNADDVLLTAHHAEDQLETVLLQLFRGAGLKGLAGIPASLPFGKGKIIRPLLDVPKWVLLDYAKSNKLTWIEDPSNQESKFDRNFLRNDIIPLLKTRWPALAETVGRSARHVADSQDLLGQLADEWLQSVIIPDDKTLNLVLLQQFTQSQQTLILRQWFSLFGLKMPSEKLLTQIFSDIIHARADANPIIQTQGRAVRRYRDKLYLLTLTIQTIPGALVWQSGQNYLQVGNNRYAIKPAIKGIPHNIWQSADKIVKFRSGGEKIALPNRTGTHDLKNVFQERGIPPWERDEIPLFYLDNRLAAVGEYWVSADFYSESETDNIQIFRQQSAKADDDEGKFV